MNFENPVYRKTTEDHFSLEKNLPVRMYPSTVDEEVIIKHKHLYYSNNGLYYKTLF